MIRVAGAIRRYFLTGLLAIIPIWGTYLVLKTLLETLDGFVGNTLREYLPYYIPGLGIIVLLLLIFTFPNFNQTPHLLINHGKIE